MKRTLVTIRDLVTHDVLGEQVFNTSGDESLARLCLGIVTPEPEWANPMLVEMVTVIVTPLGDAIDHSERCWRVRIDPEGVVPSKIFNLVPEEA